MAGQKVMDRAARAGRGNEEPGAEREPWGWTARQRVGLGILLGLLLTFLVILYARRPYRLDDAAVVVDGQAVRLPERIDPNTASVEELGRIPHIGEKLAGAIVAWREARRSGEADVVFRRVEDLDAVPGIGRKLVAEMAPYLKFPEDAAEAATQP